MKKLLQSLLCLQLLILPFFCSAQQKISGTVTYFFNDFQGNKADVGATIYVFDSTLYSRELKIIDSFISAENCHAIYLRYVDLHQKSVDLYKGTFVSKKNREKAIISIPSQVTECYTSNGFDKPGVWDSLDTHAMKASINLLYTTDPQKARADGVGNYSLNIKKPGTYYVIIQSENRKSSLSKTFVLGKLYIEKVRLKEGDEKNVSTNTEM